MSKKTLVLETLFDENDKTCVGDLYNNSIESPFTADGEFFSINPLDNVDHEWKDKSGRDYLTPRRADSNVRVYRNFLFEMDDVELPEQLEILNNVNLPWSSIVYSGGKSYHAIISLSQPLGGATTEEGIEQYKQTWKRLAAYIDSVAGKAVVDQSCKNPSRFSRFPEYKADGRKSQDIVKVGSRVEADEFSIILDKCPKVFTESTRVSRKSLDIEDVEDFLLFAPSGLVTQIKTVPFAASAGNYPHLYRIALWSIDSTGVDRDTLVSVLDSYTIPKLERLGYTRSRALVAVDHAYSIKGM